MNLTKHIQTHVDNHVHRFRHLDAHTKNIVKEIALPHIELHNLYANHPHESSFEPAEPIIDWLGELVAPLPKEIKENDLLKKKGVDMNEILAREKDEIAKVPLRLYFNDEQLATMSEEKKQEMRVTYYENHYRQEIGDIMFKELGNIGSKIKKEPQVRFAAELEVFKKKMEEFVQLQYDNVRKLFDEGAISIDVKDALLKTITVKNIVKDSIVKNNPQNFSTAEAKKGILVKENKGVFTVKNLTGAQTTTALNNIAKTIVQTTGVALNVANARAREMLRTTFNVGSLASTFLNLGGAAAAGSAAGIVLCNGIKSSVDAYFNTLIGTSTGAGLSIGILYSLYTICAVEPPNFGGVSNFIDEGLNQMSEFMGTLDEYDIGQEKKEVGIELDMIKAIGEEHDDAEQASKLTEDELVGARAWVDNFLANYENIENIDISSEDYTFKVRVGDKLLGLGTARARRDEIFSNIGDTIENMERKTFVSVNHEVKEYYLYEPFKNKRCIFTRLTMGKLISFVESLSADRKDYIFQQFHHTIPLNYKIGERMSKLVLPEDNAFVRSKDSGLYYPANCVFNIIEQAESVEMLKGHKDNRDFEYLLKKPEGNILFRLFSGLIYYLKNAFDISISFVKTIATIILDGLKTSGKISTDIIRYFTGDGIANMIEFIFSSVGYGIEYLMTNSYRHVIDFVDFVASNQTSLLIGNTICCIAAQTLLLTGVGFLFPSIPVASSYIMWKGAKLAIQMMGMQIADAILTLLGNSGRFFSRLLQNNSWLVSFISNAVPDAMAPWIKNMIALSINAKRMIAPSSTKALNSAQSATFGGAAIVFVSGVAYFAALPFAIPIGVAGGILTISGMFNSQVAASMHFSEAFRNSASFFHMTAKNMLYTLITSPYEGFSSLFKSGANITYMQLQQPIWYIDMLCQILSSGFLGRNCRKVQKMFIKFWRRSFATRFIYGFFMDLVVFSGIDSVGIGSFTVDTWTQGNCSGHLNIVQLNDYKKVKIFKWRTKNNQFIEFVVDAENVENSNDKNSTATRRPKIVQVIIDGVAHDVTSELEVTTQSKYFGLKTEKTEKWVIKSKEKFEYDKNKNIVLQKGNQKFLGPDEKTIGSELEKLLKIYNDSEYKPKQGPIETSDDIILNSDTSWELSRLSARQHESYIVLDENNVTMAICKDGELRTTPISTLNTTIEVEKTHLKGLKSWILDKKAFSNGYFKLKMEKKDGYIFSKYYRPSEEENYYTTQGDGWSDTINIQTLKLSDKKNGKSLTVDISDEFTKDTLPVAKGLNMTKVKYRVLHVPEESYLLDGGRLKWEAHDNRVTVQEHLNNENYEDTIKFFDSHLPRNMQTLGATIKEQRAEAMKRTEHQNTWSTKPESPDKKTSQKDKPERHKAKSKKSKSQAKKSKSQAKKSKSQAKKSKSQAKKSKSQAKKSKSQSKKPETFFAQTINFLAILYGEPTLYSRSKIFA
jgi:hypothetical protein